VKHGLLVANLVGWSVLALIGWSRLPPATPATDAAVARVQQEVAYSQTIAPDLPREYVVALAVNSYVVGHVSAPVHGYRNIHGRSAPTYPVPMVVEDAFLVGSGICGAATLTALALYERLDVRARPITLWYTDLEGRKVGHVTTEVFYGDAWHWFDPTWGAFYRDATVYSLLEVVQMNPAERSRTLVQNDSLLWAQVTDHVGDDPMAFTGYSPLRVELDGRVIYRR